jgi:hypothetical protein
MKSGIAQLCAIIVAERFAITIAHKIKKGSYNEKRDWSLFLADSVVQCYSKVPLSIRPPVEVDQNKEYFELIEFHAKKFANDLVDDCFLVGLSK